LAVGNLEGQKNNLGEGFGETLPNKGQSLGFKAPKFVGELGGKFGKAQGIFNPPILGPP